MEKLWQAPPFTGGALFKDKLVLVGPIAPIFQDTHPTPFGAMPGPEVQANRISTLLRNSSIQETSARYNFFMTLGMVLIALGISAAVSAVIGIAFGFFPARRASKMDPIVALRHE